MFSFQHKKVIITGGGSGIGKAMAFAFAQKGAEVHILEMDVKSADQTVNEITKKKLKAFAHQCNVAIQLDVERVFEKIGAANVLVNNAGIAHIGRADNTNEEDFDRIMSVNVKGVYNCIKAVIPQLRKSNGGVILNMASIAALVGLTDRFAYSTAKGAVKAMTMSVAKDYLHEHIRCVSISPARVHTPFVDGFIAENYQDNQSEMFDKLSKSQPIGRMGSPEEIGYLALYLCSDEASFITGVDYPIDGGFTTLNN